ncbi:MAG: hypothetical protein ACT4OM_00265 [Actinomycetota bacterium]
MDHHVSGWQARHMRRPGQPAILSVTGQCQLPAIYRAVLKVSEDQGEDPSKLILELMIHVPSGKPPTLQENKATLNIELKLPLEQEYQSAVIIDIYADEESSEPTVWEIPIKVIDWGTVSGPGESKRWKGEALSHRQN